MKNKTVKVLAIISITIIIIGILCWFGTDLIINQNDSFALLITLFGALALRLFIVICIVSSISLMWLIYGIIILIKKIRYTDQKK